MKLLLTMHWIFLPVFITITTAITIIKLSKSRVWPRRGLLRFYLLGNLINRVVQKATVIQKSRSRTLRLEHFLSGRVGQHWYYAEWRLLVYSGDTDSGYSSVMGQLGSSWNHRGCWMEAQWVLRSQAVLETPARQLLQRKPFSPVRRSFPTGVEWVWDFPRQYNCGVAYWKHLPP